MKTERIRERIVCYVAGPLGSERHWDHNVATALAHADQLQAAGIVAFVPHLFAHWAWQQKTRSLADESAPYHVWMGMDEVMLERCDCILRIPGVSFGADREWAWAEAFQLPRFTTTYDVVAAWESGKLQPKMPTACWLNWDNGTESNRWPRKR